MEQARQAGQGRRSALRVSIHHPGGRPYEGRATIRLHGGDKTTTYDKPAGAYYAEIPVEPGDFELEVTAERLIAPRRRVRVGPQGKTVSAYLGEPGWPFYRLGENIVPFRPSNDVIAVAFPANKPSREQAARAGGEILRRLPLKSHNVPDPGRREDKEPPQGAAPGELTDFMTANGAVWLFQLTEPPSPELRRRVMDGLRGVVGNEARIGVPVDLNPGQVKVIDNRFVVRFTGEVKRDEAEKILSEGDARILRALRQAPNAFLIEFPPGELLAHLKTVEEWHGRGILIYGEPDIMAQITDDVFPDDAPNDPTFTNQANLTLQQVDVAWRTMRLLGANRTLGNPAIHVATLDRGVQLGHPDIGGNLSDGNPQISRSFDFDGMREMTAAGYAPDTDHGMGVYGIIAARTDNATAIAGIAANTHQIGLERPDLTSANYPDILLWAAGFTTGNGTANWPAEPLSPAAAIISCSHGSDGLALSGAMDDALQQLAANGRGGLGTVVIYSAGNGNALITGFRTWAAHPDTLAIANSMQPDAGGVERRDPTSNFGPEIDVCAQGTNAPSLNDAGGVQTFGGTSAAAPTVAGIVALMLSKTPGLTFGEVRDILRNTAVQIDAANTNPVGQWVGGFSQWYGFGRVNAADAVCGLEPAVLLSTASVNFNDVPEGETTVRAVVFAVTSCQAVTLSITSGPGADFGTPLGTSIVLAASPTPEREARLWISYTGTTDGDTANGSVTVQHVETGEQWTIPITANTIARPTACLMLVLDQSGSMDFNSGIPALPKRIDVLKFSVPPLLEVIYDDNGLGVVRFDHDAYDAMAITAAGPPVFGAGRAAARTAVDSHAVNPAGNTAIGDGVELAHTHLAAETAYDVRSMVVFTDGHETAAKYIADVSDLISERVYAIGLGTAEQIQPVALTALTNGSGGYLLLTGELGATDYFLLAKYYLQILAGVTNEDIVVDPQGAIAPGQKHRLPFRLTETDITGQVILLTPAPATLRFTLETPHGDLITPGSVAVLPGSLFAVGRNVSFYRLTLPVPVGGGAGAGLWHAVFELDERLFRRYLQELAEKKSPLFQTTAQHGLQYSLNVHAYSNLRLRVSVGQSSHEPGATMTVRAVLTEYGLPVEKRATVTAHLLRPDATQSALVLTETEPGIFEKSITASTGGVYRFTVKASGKTLRHRPFSREQIATGAVWKGGDQRPPTSADDPAVKHERLCALLHCLLRRDLWSRDLEERLRKAGFDLDGLRKCLEQACGKQARAELTVAVDRLAQLLAQFRAQVP
jgi:hypothetical protein